MSNPSNAVGQNSDQGYVAETRNTLASLYDKVKESVSTFFWGTPPPRPEAPESKLSQVYNYLSDSVSFFFLAVKRSWVMVNEYLFTDDNWKSVATLGLIWTAILATEAVFYGFSATFTPFLIGFICSFAFGVIVGGISAKASSTSKDKENQERTSLLTLFRSSLDKCDTLHLRALSTSALTVVGTVIVALHPLAVSLLLGGTYGQHVAMSVSSEGNPSPVAQTANHT